MPGGEVWSVNPGFGPNFGPLATTFAQLQSWAAAIVLLNAGNVIPPSWRAAISNAVAVTTIRTEYFGPDGKLAQAAESILATPVAGIGAATKGFQSAVVLSLRTGRPGRSYRGRLYLPALAMVIDTNTLRIAPATRLTLATETATFLKAIGTAAPPAANILPVVVSQTVSLLTTIASISVGDILDSQRRRRDSVAELTSVGPL